MIDNNKDLIKEITAIRKGKYVHQPMAIRFGNYQAVNGQVVVDRKFKLSNTMIPKDGPNAGKMTFQMLSSGQLIMNARNLVSFEGFPPDVSFRGSTEYGSAAIVCLCIHPFLTDLTGISRRIVGDLRLGACLNINWSNANKHFDFIKGSLTISPNWKGGLLWALKIPMLESFHIEVSSGNQRKAQDVINRRLRSNNLNVLECQEELMDYGLKEYAKL